jgi:hypothetical protein
MLFPGRAEECAPLIKNQAEIRFCIVTPELSTGVNDLR